MKIPINEFEQHLDEDILKRGLPYLVAELRKRYPARRALMEELDMV